MRWNRRRPIVLGTSRDRVIRRAISIRALVVAVSVPLVISLTASPALAEAVTISRSGYYGRLVAWGNIVCANHTEVAGGNAREMNGPITWITKSRRFPASQQRVYVRHRIDYWDPAPGTSGWKIGSLGPWREGGYDPTRSALYQRRVFRMPSQQFYIDATHYGHFRIVTNYRYVRYGRTIGRVRNMYDQYSHLIQATNFPSPYVAQNGALVPTWCTFPIVIFE